MVVEPIHGDKSIPHGNGVDDQKPFSEAVIIVPHLKEMHSVNWCKSKAKQETHIFFLTGCVKNIELTLFVVNFNNLTVAGKKKAINKSENEIIGGDNRLKSEKINVQERKLKKKPVSGSGIILLDEVSIHKHLGQGRLSSTTCPHDDHLVFGIVGLLLRHLR
jgi:hypothetical protein